ncbi:LRR receptor-like serine/threonine-protein kinase EFR [Hevea brasiliensis]|uniref:LRR receptor-like serine/threonine-protein kinase EFR n=1 Tax=Hevea brasiliensis TaxID=3981 RepID=UPI0025FF7226|nr:LRR receptor-like serine/threonine-protein kinase EFR [Hevea brasiliensis]
MAWNQLEGNNLTGSIPSSFGNLSSLAKLYLHTNSLLGSIPNGLGRLTNLIDIWVGTNSLFGDIPLLFFDLSSLINFNVAVNQIHRVLPSDIGITLPNMQHFAISANHFTGTIPVSISNASKLEEFLVSDNKLTGSVPSTLRNCQNLQILNLSTNNLTSAIPPQVVGLATFIFLDLSDNHLIGNLPSNIGILKNLGKFHVHGNMLSGEIPSSFGSCVSLEILDVGNNSFQGSIPSSLSSLRGIVPTDGVFKNLSVVPIMRNTKRYGGISKFHLPACNFKRSTSTRSAIKLKAIIASFMEGFLGVILVLTLLFLLRLRKKNRAFASLTPQNTLFNLSYCDLHEATNGFSSANLVGIGSFGSVYKGIFGEDRALIVVKVLNLQHHKATKSIIAECEAFRNVRHQNLVKVLIACSSIDYQGNDFKALVFEFMVNGSLEERLHSPVIEDGNEEASKSLNLL